MAYAADADAAVEIAAAADDTPSHLILRQKRRLIRRFRRLLSSRLCLFHVFCFRHVRRLLFLLRYAITIASPPPLMFAFAACHTPLMSFRLPLLIR